MLANNANKLVSLALISLLLQGCADSNMTDLRDFVADAYKDKRPEIDPLPEIQPYRGFEYASTDKNEPFNFENIVSNRDGEAAVTGKRPDANRIKEPLEEFPLDALNMVGTMSQRGVPWVIVKTTQGTAHLASIGNYLGQNDGKITQIFPEEQRVVLVETVADPAGRWVTRDVEITIDEQ
ncbi:MAG: type IV pilus assembly protein PilP [Arenicella sp.]|jgi:type IV pilus assembly protein PilP